MSAAEEGKNARGRGEVFMRIFGSFCSLDTFTNELGFLWIMEEKEVFSSKGGLKTRTLPSQFVNGRGQGHLNRVPVVEKSFKWEQMAFRSFVRWFVSRLLHSLNGSGSSSMVFIHSVSDQIWMDFVHPFEQSPVLAHCSRITCQASYKKTTPTTTESRQGKDG